MAKTLADMTAEERADCVGMWAEHAHPHYDGLEVIIDSDHDSVTTISTKSGQQYIVVGEVMRHITPRFDLPRAWTPDGEPVEMVKEYGIFYTLHDGDEEICFVHDSPLSVEPAVKHLEKSLRRGTITKITRKTQWVTEWEEVPEPQRTNGMVNPYV